MEIIKDTEFEEKVLKSNMPVLVDFYADWCGPCKMMSPVVEQLSDQFAGKCRFYKINVDDAQEMARRYKVMSIPMFILFQDGEVKEKILGAVPANQLEEAIRKLI